MYVPEHMYYYTPEISRYSYTIHYVPRSYIYGKRKTRKAIAIKIKTENLQRCKSKKESLFSQKHSHKINKISYEVKNNLKWRKKKSKNLTSKVTKLTTYKAQSNKTEEQKSLASSVHFNHLTAKPECKQITNTIQIKTTRRRRRRRRRSKKSINQRLYVYIHLSRRIYKIQTFITIFRLQTRKMRKEKKGTHKGKRLHGWNLL